MNLFLIGRRTLTESFCSSANLFLRLCAFLFFFPPTNLSPIAHFSSSADQPHRNEMLVPINSTSALICETVFYQAQSAGDEEEAKWMKDGTEVGRVNGHSNAILGTERTPSNSNSAANHRRGMEPIPNIGFLVITNTLPQDEGEYWCERVTDGQRGESTRLKVAYLTPFEHGQRPKLVKVGDQNEEGELTLLECPNVRGVPTPVINWLFNGDRIDFASQNMQMMPNGSLLVHNISANQSGFFACEAANFVGRSVSSEFFLAPPKVPPMRHLSKSVVLELSAGRSTSFLVDCLSAYVRNGVLWFLIGCLATSCFVLAYILCALLLYRFYSLHHNRHRWHRFFLSVAPGFRKTVAPMAEQMAPLPPPYCDSVGANEL